MQPAVGAKVGRFTLVRPIETDDERTMWLGSHEAFGTMQLAAIDLPPEGDPDPARATALRREAEVGQQLSHEGVQRVLEVGEIEGRSFIAREYVEGITLARLQAPLEALRSTDDSLRLACIVHIVGLVLDVLAHTHAIQTVSGLPAGVIHGQLTAHDVLVSTNGKIKIAGFGLDRRPQDGTAAMMSHDALRSLAPELLTGAPVQPIADLYSTGILLHTLLEGEPPWAECEGIQVYQAIASGKALQLRRSVPQELATVHAALVEPNMMSRIASADAAAKLLRGWSAAPPDPTSNLGNLVREVLHPRPARDLFDDLSGTSSQLRPAAVAAGAVSSPVSPPDHRGPPAGPAFVPPPLHHPSSPPSVLPQHVPPSAVQPSLERHVPSASAVSSPQQATSPSSPPLEPQSAPLSAPAPSVVPALHPARAASNDASSASAFSSSPAASGEVDEGTLMFDPDTLARMRAEAMRSLPRTDSTGPAAGSSVRPVAASSNAPAPPPMVAGVIGAPVSPSEPRPVRGGSRSQHPQQPRAAPPPRVQVANRGPAVSPVVRPNHKPAPIAPAADIGEGTTTAMLIRRERRSLGITVVAGTLVAVILAVVIAYLIIT